MIVKLNERPTKPKEKDLFDVLMGSAAMYKKDVTPQKGKDYFTPEEIEEIKKSITPIKGKDYFTKDEINAWLRSVTPVKGKHYFDGEKGEDGIDGKDGLSIKGEDGHDGRDGKDAEIPDLQEFKKEMLDSINELKGKKLSVKDVDGLEDRINKLAVKVEKNYGGHGGTVRNIKTTLVSGGLYNLTSPYPILGEMEVYVGGGRLFFESGDFTSTITGGNKVTQINLSTAAQFDITQGSALIVRGK
jgi:hypothetical protein